jgi:Ca-activated chloride channel family protein
MRIGHALTIAIVCLAGATLAFAQSVPPPPPPELPVPSTQSAVQVSVDLVMVDVTVKAKDGKIIRDLRKDDFEILEDGVPQKIEVLSRDELPLNVALVLDLSDSVGPYLKPLRDTMTAALSALKPEDQVALFTFASTAQLRVFLTNDKTRIAQQISTVPAGGATNINDGIFIAAKYLLDTHPNGRRVIILISDDVGTSPGSHWTPEITAEALDADAALYNLKVPGNDPQEVLRASRGMASLVYIPSVIEQTGGESFEVKKVTELDETFRNLIARIKTRYTLGYYTKLTPGGRKPNELHKLEVNLAPSFGKKGHDYVVVAKTGFYLH